MKEPIFFPPAPVCPGVGASKVDGSVAQGWRLVDRVARSTLLKWLTRSQDRKGGSKARMGEVDWEEKEGLRLPENKEVGMNE